MFIHLLCIMIQYIFAFVKYIFSLFFLSEFCLFCTVSRRVFCIIRSMHFVYTVNITVFRGLCVVFSHFFSRRVFFQTHFSKIRSYRKICKYTFIRMQIYILITKKTQSNIRTAFSLFFICRLLLFAGNSFSARLQFSWAAASYCSSIRVFSIIYRGRRFVSRYILPIYSPIIPIAKSCKPPSAHTDTISEVQPLTVLPVKWRMSE